MIGSKVTAVLLKWWILPNGEFCLLVELHRKESACLYYSLFQWIPVLTSANIRNFRKFPNPNGHQNHMIGSKVTVIFLETRRGGPH